MPEYAHVGLVTYGTHVHVHELGFTECSKCFVFRGSKEYSVQQVVEQLGLGRAAGRLGPAAASGPAAPPHRFMTPLSECEFMVNSVLEELQKDAYPVMSSHRPARCTGTALMVRQQQLLGGWVSWTATCRTFSTVLPHTYNLCDVSCSMSIVTSSTVNYN